MRFKDKKIPNVPNLRFKEFNAEWESKYMGSVCTFYKGSGISKEDLASQGNPCILYGELYTTYKSAIAKDIKSKTMLEPTNLFHSKANDVIIPCSGETAIDISTAVCVPYDDVLLGGDLTVIRSNLNGAFLSSQINGVRRKNIAVVAQGASIVHLHADDLKKIIIRYPSIKEQDKIANFLALLDDRIDTQSKIIEDYESQIKWIRTKIFKMIDNKHIKTTIGAYLTSYSEKNNIGITQAVAIGKYGIRKRDDIYSKNLTDDYSSNKIIRKNTLIIGMGTTQIDIGILLDDEIYCVSPAYSTYKINNINSSYLNEYLIYLNPLLSNKYMITSARQGKSVNKDGLMKHIIYIHDDIIQNKIASLFNALYIKIKKEKDILNAYQKQKAYLLKEMFI